MPGWKQLKDVAAAVAGSFVSRNNDVDRRWAIGRLRAFADAKGTRELRFDLLRGESTPPDPLPTRVAATWRAFLSAQLAKRRLPPDWLDDAEVSLTFGREEGTPVPYPSYGDPFTCRVTLRNQQGRSWSEAVSARADPYEGD